MGPYRLGLFGRLLLRDDENIEEMYAFVRRTCRRLVTPITKRCGMQHQLRGAAVRGI